MHGNDCKEERATEQREALNRVNVPGLILNPSPTPSMTSPDVTMPEREMSARSQRPISVNML